MTRTRTVIRPMRPADIDAVVQIEQQVHPRPWSAALFGTELALLDRRYRTAWEGEVLVGYGGVLLAVDEAHITTVAVDPRARRRGIGGRLVEALLEAAVDMGATAATLEVGSANHGAQRLYSAFGFVPAGVRPRYYEATGEDAIIMWAYDLAGPDIAARRHHLRGQRDVGPRQQSQVVG